MQNERAGGASVHCRQVPALSDDAEMTAPGHEILFEPVRIGPVTTKNRFYQVPHCTGMGWHRPRALAALRGMKAEGGWGVVCTEYCSVHPTSDDGNLPFASLWDDEDVRAHAWMTEAVHEHGALAGVELWHGGAVANLDSRLPALSIRSRAAENRWILPPVQTRRLEKSDIRDIHRLQGRAARRAREAGFDIVYVYAAHEYLLGEFLDADRNDRGDEYGGSVENRVRIIRELIEITREAVGDECAVAARFTIDAAVPETCEAFALLSELPDLWDLTVSDYDVEMGSSRFVKEGALAHSVARAKAMTGKPVVAVGRFTSPDSMVLHIRNGTQDLIGAARPSISDPFLPNKIKEGRSEDVRECIGCNVCFAHNAIGVPIRCTQNPTMGEEWRRGWHPEHIAPDGSIGRVLVIGGGPAGLEVARVLGRRGGRVMLAESRRSLGGRVDKESRLPGLSEWRRVADWRLVQIGKLDDVELFPGSPMSASDALELEADHIIVATGARWTTDGVGRRRATPFELSEGVPVLSADNVMEGDEIPPGRALIFDDDHYYLGSVLALELRRRGHEVVIVTPAGRVGHWSAFTSEQDRTYAALIEEKVEIVPNQVLEGVEEGLARTSCVFSGRETSIGADWVLPLTRREPNDGIYWDILAEREEGALASIRRIGDCEAPGIIASAVYSGYRIGVEMDASGGAISEETKRERERYLP